MTEREPYSSPAEPVVVGGVESAELGYVGRGTDFSIYSSTPPPV